MSEKKSDIEMREIGQKFEAWLLSKGTLPAPDATQAVKGAEVILAVLGEMIEDFGAKNRSLMERIKELEARTAAGEDEVIDEREPKLLPWIKDELDEWARGGEIETAFCLAILTNDLRAACEAAQSKDVQDAIYGAVSYCYSSIPAGSWGSCAIVEAWQTAKATPLREGR